MTYATSPIGPVTTAIELADLADWLVVDVSDPVLPMVARLATAHVIEYLQSELVERQRTVVYQQWPARGSYAHLSISPRNDQIEHDVMLPYAQLISVESVTAYGEALDAADYRILDTKPASIRLSPQYATSDDFPALSVEYAAGFGPTAQDVPEEIRIGIMTLAGYLYEHRGACDVDMAMRSSGAAAMLYPYKLRAVAL